MPAFQAGHRGSIPLTRSSSGKTMKKIIKIGFVNSIIAAAYIVGVAFIIFNGDKIFGKMNNVIGPITLLLLLVLSAFVVGGLLLAKPVMMYIDGKKKESVSLLVISGAWILVYFIIAVIIMLVLK